MSLAMALNVGGRLSGLRKNQRQAEAPAPYMKALVTVNVFLNLTTPPGRRILAFRYTTTDLSGG
jgi:hypothetical protein